MTDIQLTKIIAIVLLIEHQIANLKYDEILFIIFRFKVMCLYLMAVVWMLLRKHVFKASTK